MATWGLSHMERPTGPAHCATARTGEEAVHVAREVSVAAFGNPLSEQGRAA